MNERHWPSLLLVLAAQAALLLLTWWLFETLPEHPWEGWTLTQSALDHEYCELTDLDAAIRQPSNSWSNLIYFFFGCLVLRDVWLDRRRKGEQPVMRSSPGYGMALALVFGGLCFGSFFFHASLTRTGQLWDMTFTYGLSATLLAGILYRLGTPRLWRHSALSQAVLVVLVIAATVFFYAFKWQLEGKTALGLLFGGIILGALALPLLYRGRFHLWMGLVAVAMLFVAIWIRELDVAKVGCDPASVYQGHALWHVLTAASAYLTYQYLRREKG